MCFYWSCVLTVTTFIIYYVAIVDMGRNDESVSITLPAQLKQKIRASAYSNSRSLTQEIRIAIEEYRSNHAADSTFETVEEYEKDPLRNMTFDDLKDLIREVTTETIKDEKKVNK